MIPCFFRCGNNYNYLKIWAIKCGVQTPLRRNLYTTPKIKKATYFEPRLNLVTFFLVYF